MLPQTLLQLAFAMCTVGFAVPQGSPGKPLSFPIKHVQRDMSEVVKRAAFAVPHGSPATPLDLHFGHSLRDIAPLSKRDESSPMAFAGMEGSYLYTVELNIGTPAQKVGVIVDTGSNVLWVNPDCTRTDSSSRTFCRNAGQYTPASSSSSVNLRNTGSLEYLTGATRISYYADNVALGGSSINLKNVSIGVATSSSVLPAGILGVGFGFGRNADVEYPNIVDELKAENYTQSKALSVGLGPFQGQSQGNLIFGGLDTKKFSGKLEQIPIVNIAANETRYMIQADSVGITKPGQSASTYSGSSFGAILDTGATFSYLPKSVFNSIRTDLNGKTQSGLDYVIADCALRQQGGSFNFVFKGMTIRVPYSEFIVPIGQLSSGSAVCAIGALPLDSDSIGILGGPFMRSAYVVFDQDNFQLALAQFVDCGTNERVLPAGRDQLGQFTGECSASSSNSGSSAASGLTSNLWLMAAVVAGVQALLSIF